MEKSVRPMFVVIVLLFGGVDYLLTENLKLTEDSAELEHPSNVKSFGSPSNDVARLKQIDDMAMGLVGETTSMSVIVIGLRL